MAWRRRLPRRARRKRQLVSLGDFLRVLPLGIRQQPDRRARRQLARVIGAAGRRSSWRRSPASWPKADGSSDPGGNGEGRAGAEQFVLHRRRRVFQGASSIHERRVEDRAGAGGHQGDDLPVGAALEGTRDDVTGADEGRAATRAPRSSSATRSAGPAGGRASGGRPGSDRPLASRLMRHQVDLCDGAGQEVPAGHLGPAGGRLPVESDVSRGPIR